MAIGPCLNFCPNNDQGTLQSYMNRFSRRRFSALSANNPGVLVRTGNRGLARVEKVAFSRPCTPTDLAAICGWAGLDNPRLVGVSKAGFRRLLSVAAQRRPTNHYHHAGHFAHVIIAAGLLAYAGALTARERSLLVLAALVHDLDHCSRYASQKMFVQEQASARRVSRIIIGAGGDARLSLRLVLLLKATALTDHKDRKTILNSDRIARLLADADLFSSLFFSRQRAIRLTRALKLERMSKGSASEQYDAFVTATMRTGPHSDAARRLLSRKDEGSASLRQACTMSDI